MDPIVWILIIGLLLVIAVGAWLLTRKPSGPGSGAKESQEESTADAETRRADEVERYDVGGDHVAAGDAPTDERSTEPYDQEADEDEHPAVWQEEDGAGQDTATGGEVTIVEDEPSHGVHERESETSHVDRDHGGDRQQMTYGDAETEDFASETTYADPEHDARYAGSAEPMAAERHDGQGSENLGPEEGEGDPGDVADDDRGHPGPQSQPAHEATYDTPTSEGAGSENVGPESGEGDLEVEDGDHGHPGATSQDEGEAVYGVPEQTDDPSHDDIPSDAHAAGFADIDQDRQSREHETAPTPDVVVVETVEVAEGSGEVPEDEFVRSEPAQDERVRDEPTRDEPVQEELVSAEPTRDEPTSNGGIPADAVIVETETVKVEPVDVRDDDSDVERTEEPLVAEDAPADVHPAALDSDVADTHEGTDAREADAERSRDRSASEGGGATALSATGARADTEHHDTEHHDTEHHDTEPDHDNAGAMPEDRAENDRGSHGESALTTSAAPVGKSDPVDVDEHDRAEETSRDSRDDTVTTDEPSRDRASVEHEEPIADNTAADEETLARDERVADGERGAHEQTHDEQTHDESTSEESDEVFVVEGPYGSGSAMPAEDGSHPEGYEIKGNAGSMLFHTDDSPVYADYAPDVWFDSEESAKEAGFAHWDRKRR